MTPRPGSWVKWRGGVCPLPPDQIVEVKFRDKTLSSPVPARELDWTHYGEGTDIFGYRRSDPAKAAP